MTFNRHDNNNEKALWGELAWQLSCYDLVADADQHGVNPGEFIRQILELSAPCVILIDEWVSHARQLYFHSDLPAGTFDAK
jgi:predicted AAA+ superfamily ATPase